jgi:hypothetical protein
MCADGLESIAWIEEGAVRVFLFRLDTHGLRRPPALLTWVCSTTLG